MNRLILIAAVALVTCLGGSPAFAAAPKTTSPLPGNGLMLRVIPSAGDTDCTAWRGGVKEAGIVSALLGALLPKAIDVGLDSLASALHKASGEDDKTAVTETLARSHVYEYDVTFKIHSWNKDMGCLRAMTSDGSFDVGLVFTPSRDNSAFALRLAKLKYTRQINPGRELVGMTMAVIFKAPDGTEIAHGILPGPFVLSNTEFVANTDADGSPSADTGKNPIISTGWMPMPPAGEASQKLLAAYEEQCALRAEAGAAYKTAETAKAKAKAKKDGTKFVPDPALDMAPNDGALCGKFLPGNFASPDWSSGKESNLAELRKAVRKQAPVTVQLVVTETRDVNKFLLKLSEVLAGSKEGVKAALLEKLDPEKKAAAKKTEDGIKQDYDIALAQFKEKVRLYEVAVAAQVKAEQKLADLQTGGDAEAIATAQEAAEKARTDRAAAFEAALTARKAARAAAFDAGVSIGPGNPLETFAG